MDYTAFFRSTLTDLGFDLVPVWNCFDPPHSTTRGWPLKLPAVDFKSNTLLLLHFQDFITPGDSIIELQKVENYYKDHARQILVTHWTHDLKSHYQGPINLIEFSSHNIQTIESIADRKHQWIDSIVQPKNLAWQCLNGRKCPHRLRAVQILESWPKGMVSYGDVITLNQWNYATYQGTENHENFVRLAPLYGQAAVNVVTETQYDSRPGIVTEKTLMAMIAGQVPVIIGHAGIVQDCKELGFDMFDGLVDTSYDWLPNDQRVEQALLRNQDLIQGKIDLGRYQQRLQAQQEYVLYHHVEQVKSYFIDQARKLAIHFSTSP